jgi:hypothetical protein
VIFLIWSNAHAMWWRPDRAGFTQHIEEAGRYDAEQADDIIRTQTVGGKLAAQRTNPITGERYQQFTEVKLLAPEVSANAYMTGRRDVVEEIIAELHALDIVERTGRDALPQDGAS